MFKTRYLRKEIRLFISLLQKAFGKIGIGITSYANLINLKENALDQGRQDLGFIRALSPVNYELVLSLLEKSKSQLRQDLFVLSELGYRREGYFVEFGATNGIDLSNSYLLETEFSWTGILAEPGRVWKKELQSNRPNSSIETLCVWKDSNSILTFNETEDPELSTIDIFSGKDSHKDSRQDAKSYQVHTISLNDLLIKHNAPKYIDYLSIDTEGSEYEILRAFAFEKYAFGVITVEHNFTPQRELIFALLTKNGYRRKYENISSFDDWYVKI